MLVRALTGVDGDKLVDQYSEGPTNKLEKCMDAKHSEVEISIIQSELKQKGQEEWKRGSKGG